MLNIPLQNIFLPIENVKKKGEPRNYKVALRKK